jgi:hypothetical protein
MRTLPRSSRRSIGGSSARYVNGDTLRRASTHVPNRGLTAPPASHGRRWNSWRSWPHSSPCHASIWCAMPGVWRPIASCRTRSFRHRANRWRRHRLVPLPGTGPGCWGACLRWIWPPVPCADAARSVLLLLLPSTQESVIMRILRHCKLVRQRGLSRLCATARRRAAGHVSA